MEGLEPSIDDRLLGRSKTRIMISTPMSESQVAEYLTKLQAEVKAKGVSVGSYPRWGKKRNTVTLTGMYADLSTPKAALKGGNTANHGAGTRTTSIVSRHRCFATSRAG